jgi:hypothetical protein
MTRDRLSFFHVVVFHNSALVFSKRKMLGDTLSWEGHDFKIANPAPKNGSDVRLTAILESRPAPSVNPPKNIFNSCTCHTCHKLSTASTEIQVIKLL